MEMRHFCIAALLAGVALPAWADSTINNLSAGIALAGTEKIPMFQTANPAVTTTPDAIKTYITSASVTVTGDISANNVTASNGSLQASANAIVGAGQIFTWNGRSSMWSPSDGVIEMTNNAATAFTRLQLGGTTSSFPAIKRNGNAITLRQADDTIPTVSSLTACATGLDGSLAAVSDATVTTTGTVVVGSSSHHDLVYCNGTSWLVVTGT